jgi:hypothetical protein
MGATNTPASLKRNNLFIVTHKESQESVRRRYQCIEDAFANAVRWSEAPPGSMTDFGENKPLEPVSRERPVRSASDVR